MMDQPRDVLIECSEMINKPAHEVWSAVRCFKVMQVPQRISNGWAVESNSKPASNNRPLSSIAMEERVVEMDDPLMVLRMEMTTGQNVPWTSYESRVRVAATGKRSSQTTITCLVRPTSEPNLVEGMLRATMVLSLQALKRRLEAL